MMIEDGEQASPPHSSTPRQATTTKNQSLLQFTSPSPPSDSSSSSITLVNNNKRKRHDAGTVAVVAHDTRESLVSSFLTTNRELSPSAKRQRSIVLFPSFEGGEVSTAPAALCHDKATGSTSNLFSTDRDTSSLIDSSTSTNSYARILGSVLTNNNTNIGQRYPPPISFSSYYDNNMILLPTMAMRQPPQSVCPRLLSSFQKDLITASRRNSNITSRSIFPSQFISQEQQQQQTPSFSCLGFDAKATNNNVTNISCSPTRSTNTNHQEEQTQKLLIDLSRTNRLIAHETIKEEERNHMLRLLLSCTMRRENILNNLSLHQQINLPSTFDLLGSDSSSSGGGRVSPSSLLHQQRWNSYSSSAPSYPRIEALSSNHQKYFSHTTTNGDLHKNHSSWWQPPRRLQEGTNSNLKCKIRTDHTGLISTTTSTHSTTARTVCHNDSKIRRQQEGEGEGEGDKNKNRTPLYPTVANKTAQKVEHQSICRISTQEQDDKMIKPTINSSSAGNVTTEEEDHEGYLLLPRCYDDVRTPSSLPSSKNCSTEVRPQEDNKKYYDERKKSNNNKHEEEKDKQKEANKNKTKTKTGGGGEAPPIVLTPRTRRNVEQNRKITPLGIEKQDINHPLSKFLCFVRLECIEVFKATQDDVNERLSSKRVKINQAGIRCRFCAHLRDRKGRSSNFPSSIPRIYQGVSMMIYKHFPVCDQMPTEVRSKYNELKKLTKRGDVCSQEYWNQSANAIGLIDTPEKNGLLLLSQGQTNQKLNN